MHAFKTLQKCSARKLSPSSVKIFCAYASYSLKLPRPVFELNDETPKPSSVARSAECLARFYRSKPESDDHVQHISQVLEACIHKNISTSRTFSVIRYFFLLSAVCKFMWFNIPVNSFVMPGHNHRFLGINL